MKRFFVGLLCILCLSSVAFPAQSPDAEDIVRRSVELTQKDWKQTPDYDYFQRELEPGHSKTYEVLMILGSRYRRLVAVDDKPLPPELAAREEELLQKARSDREHESPQQRQARVDRYKKESDQQNLFSQSTAQSVRLYPGRRADAGFAHSLRGKSPAAP